MKEPTVFFLRCCFLPIPSPAFLAIPSVPNLFFTAVEVAPTSSSVRIEFVVVRILPITVALLRCDFLSPLAVSHLVIFSVTTEISIFLFQALFLKYANSSFFVGPQNKPPLSNLP